MRSTGVTLGEVVAALDRRYPPALAESWDAVGLVAGDPAAPVRKVLFAVDPVAAVVDEALEWGADLLVTHHPLYLRPVHSVAATTFKGSVIHRLIRGGCALYAAHTNADSAPGGVADVLAEAIGVGDRRPLVARSATAEDATASTVGIGRVGRLATPMTLQQFATQVAHAIPATAQGVRVAGDLAATVETVAVVGGAGDSLFDDVRASGVDVYVTADLRHHPASEAREQAIFGDGKPYLIDLSHFASEWPWLTGAAAELEEEFRPATDADSEPRVASAAGTLECKVSTVVTDPWTAVIANSR